MNSLGFCKFSDSNMLGLLHGFSFVPLSRLTHDVLPRVLAVSCAGVGSVSKLVPPKSVVVKVEGLHSVDRRDALIKGMLGVKGITSVTVDQRKGAVIAYTYKNVDDIKAEIADAIRAVDVVTLRASVSACTGLPVGVRVGARGRWRVVLMMRG